MSWGLAPAITPAQTPEYRDWIVQCLRRDPEFAAKMMGGMTHQPDRKMVLTLARAISRADLVLWDSNYWLAASKGHESFVGKIYPWPAHVHQFWIFNNDILLSNLDQKAFGFKEEMVFGELWLSVLDGFVYCAQLMHPAAPKDEPDDLLDYAMPRILVGSWKTSDPVSEHLAPIVAEYHFMNTPTIADPTPYRWPRPDRRRAQKAGRELPEVKVVTLRRQIERPDANDPEARTYNCRWIVSAHWRNQYLPSSGDHRPTWIEAYLKGPEDKPFLKERPTVYKVTR